MKPTLGQRLKKIRLGVAWTQADLAKESGVSASAISRFEQGRQKPTIESADRLADALGVTLDWLIRGRK